MSSSISTSPATIKRSQREASDLRAELAEASIRAAALQARIDALEAEPRGTVQARQEKEKTASRWETESRQKTQGELPNMPDRYRYRHRRRTSAELCNTAAIEAGFGDWVPNVSVVTGGPLQVNWPVEKKQAATPVTTLVRQTNGVLGQRAGDTREAQEGERRIEDEDGDIEMEDDFGDSADQWVAGDEHSQSPVNKSNTFMDNLREAESFLRSVAKSEKARYKASSAVSNTDTHGRPADSRVHDEMNWEYVDVQASRGAWGSETSGNEVASGESVPHGSSPTYLNLPNKHAGEPKPRYTFGQSRPASPPPIPKTQPARSFEETGGPRGSFYYRAG